MRTFIKTLIILLFLTSCGDVGKVLRNEKINSTDEFLVKKKGPLVLPPNYEEIPTPDSILKKTDKEQDKIKSILKAPKKQSGPKTNSSSVEQSILEKIRK